MKDLSRPGRANLHPARVRFQMFQTPQFLTKDNADCSILFADSDPSRANEHCHPRKLFGSAVPFLPAQPTAPPAISALQGMFKKANHFLETQGGWRCMHAYV
jgi:hypothetical protein